MNVLKWLYPGMRVKRWLLIFIAGVAVVAIGFSIFINQANQGFFGALGRELRNVENPLLWSFIAIVAGALAITFGFRQVMQSVTSALLPEGDIDNGKIVSIVHERRQLRRGPKIVAVGGGTGLSTLLRGIKGFTSNITAIVTVADDGGSSGQLRREMGVLPPGDIRNCLVALADAEPLMQRLFQYRFKSGDPPELVGHSFGNLFIATMSEIAGDFERAIKESSKILAVRGQVLPSTLEDVSLHAELEDGTIVHGESNISKSKSRIRRVFIRPEHVEPVVEAIEAIRNADIIVLGPGSLFTSVLPNLLVKGIADEIRRSRAIKVYACNVMTQPGETDGFTAADHVRAILGHVGEGVIDCVLVNHGAVPGALLERYLREGAEQVAADIEDIERLGLKVLEGDLICETDFARHDPGKLARAIMRML
ncbi:MAG: YvcK family protein [Firmicutes bacterium]|nr:YvcK family protein [Bacillota bacterium]